MHVADEGYYLPETLVFLPAESGTAQYPVVYRAEHEGNAVPSGDQKLTRPAPRTGERAESKFLL